MNSETTDDVERCKDIETIKRLIIEYEEMFIDAKKKDEHLRTNSWTII